jgi:4-amino-4-deoxy-L-arabinose transferase-like glycosyltransferase
LAHRAVLVPSLIGAAGTMVFAQHAFWRGSPNLDEVAYEAQASALAHHRLTLSAATLDPYFRPFLSGLRGGRVVFKYQPVWPALLALSRGLFGSTLPLRVALGAGGVAAVYVLAYALFRRRHEALLAAYLVALCPFLWIQAATTLGYQLSFVLATSAAAAFVAAVSKPRPYAWIAGALFGVAVVHRPFDAIVPTLPFIVYALWASRRDDQLQRFAALAAVGVVPFIVIGALYNQVVMGAPWRVPFGVTGPMDRFGFGWRASFEVPGSGRGGQIHYTIGEALSALAHSLAAFPRFLVAAPVIIVFALIAVFGRRRDIRTALLGISVVCVLVGYLYWWGTANAVHFGIHATLGPFYHYFVVAPVVILAAHALARLQRKTTIAMMTVVAIAWALPASWLAFRNARHAGQVRANEIALASPTGHALVLETPLFPGDPYLRIANSADLSDRRIVATDIPGRELELIDRFPDRTPYIIDSYRAFDDAFGPQLTTRLRAAVIRSRALRFRLRVHLPGKRHGDAYVRIDNRRAVFGRNGTAIDTSWEVSPHDFANDAGTHTITIGLRMGRDWYECRFQTVSVNNQLNILTPYAGYRRYNFPNGKVLTSHQDLTPFMHISIRTQ